MIDDNDKKVLINTINKKGFLLEEKTWKVMSEIASYCHKFHLIQDKEERVEIDVVAKLDNKIFIIECKHTDYSWIFSKSSEKVNSINLIYNYGQPEGYNVVSRMTKNFESAWSHMSVLLKDDGKLVLSTKKLAQSSYKDVSDAVTQVLKESKAFIQNPNIDTKYSFIIPVIVTNNPLLYLSYSEDNMDKKGELLDYKSLEPISGVIYNYPEIWGVENKGEYRKQFGDGKIKSVFIVNIENLGDFIKKIAKENLAGIESGKVRKI